ncbi:MAG TPA: hypothetical protein VJA21_19115 [Verrucomicrobiae bacterium]
MSLTKATIATVIACLLLIDVCLRARPQSHKSGSDNFNDLLALVNVQTNTDRGIMLVDKKTGDPLWAKYVLGGSNGNDCLSLFFNRRDVVDVFPQRSGPPWISVTFYGEDGSVNAIWASKGNNACFTERRQSEHEFKREVWFDEAWHPVDYRTNQGSTLGGIVVSGKWQHLLFTNGSWAVEP